MEFTMHGFDVYTSEVDDHGIDFVIRTDDNKYYDIQVKSIRGYSYIFFPKDKFEKRDNLLAAVVIFIESEEPRFHLIPSTAWVKHDKLFKDYDYDGKKSKPEWGLQISKATLELLEPYNFELVVGTL
jgi:hypothetical protein